MYKSGIRIWPKEWNCTKQLRILYIHRMKTGKETIAWSDFIPRAWLLDMKIYTINISQLWTRVAWIIHKNNVLSAFHQRYGYHKTLYGHNIYCYQWYVELSTLPSIAVRLYCITLRHSCAAMCYLWGYGICISCINCPWEIHVFGSVLLCLTKYDQVVLEKSSLIKIDKQCLSKMHQLTSRLSSNRLGHECNSHVNNCARSWWRHQMVTFSALLAICAGNSPVPGEFPAQRPVTRSFDIFYDLRLNKRLSKQSWSWWFETLSRPWWRHCNVTCVSVVN